MKNTLLVVILLFGLQERSFSCSCVWGGSFLKVSNDTSLVDIVAVVKVKRHLNLKGRYDRKTPMSMEVEVVEVLRGTERRRTIEIWGDNGMMCRSYISEFPEGTTWILALRHGSETWGHRGETKSNYAISGCGEYSLELKRKRVIGLIEKKARYYQDKQGNYVESKDEKMRVKKFKRKLEALRNSAA